MPRRLFMGDERPMDEDNPFGVGGGRLRFNSNISKSGQIINIPQGSNYAFEKGAAAFSGLGLVSDPDFWKKVGDVINPKKPAGKRPASRSPIVTRAKAKKPAIVTPSPKGPTAETPLRGRGIPLPPMLESLPVSNLQAMGKRAGTDGEEVPVMPPPSKVSKIHPDYFTISLPYIYRFDSFASANLVYANDRPLLRIRLNSIYDPIKEVNATVVGVGDDPLFDADTQPQGRDIWASHFKYYRVLGSRVKLTFLNGYPVKIFNQGANRTAFHNAFAVGYELVDEDGIVSNNTEMFLTTKHANRAIMGPGYSAFEYVGTQTDELTANVRTKIMTYDYNPSNWTYHVEETGSEERWTPIKQNPSIDHDLAVRVMHLDDTNAPEPTSAGLFCLMVQIEYLVQFREATDSFFKTQTTTTATYGGDGEDAVDD